MTKRKTRICDLLSPSQQEYFQLPYKRVYKERTPYNYCQSNLEKYGLEFEKNDHQSILSTLMVGSHDIMVITTPEKDIRKRSNKSFGMFFEAGDIPYNVDNEQVENRWTACFEIDNHNVDIDAGFEVNQYDRSGFSNPTDENPMKASLFLNYHQVPETVKQLLCSRYKSLKHYHKDIEAMFKILIYQRIRRIRYYTRVVRHLKDYTDDCELLGFIKDETGKYHIPDKKTIGHFENIRLGITGLQIIRDSYVLALKDKLAKYGYILGEKVGIDSTPLVSLSKDPDAKYNAHYDKLMYKVHIVTDIGTNIPLFVMVTSGTEYDGHYLIPILEKLNPLDIHPKKIYGDEHYDTMENWAVTSLKYDVKCQINLAENAVFRDDGKPENLQKEYQKLYRNNDFKPQDQISFDEMLQYLFEHDKYECVGAYFRNQWYLKWKKYKMELEESGDRRKNPRSKSEGLHGHIKENMMFEVFMDGRGMKYAEKHVNMILISLLVVALTRVQYGVLDGLTRIACLT